MAAPKAPLVGGAKKDVTLDASVFAAEVKPHLIHETVRAEMAAGRSGTHSAKSRGLVHGGRAKASPTRRSSPACGCCASRASPGRGRSCAA